MKHCIIVKFIPEISRKIEKSFVQQIKELFENCTDEKIREKYEKISCYGPLSFIKIIKFGRTLS